MKKILNFSHITLGQLVNLLLLSQSTKGWTVIVSKYKGTSPSFCSKYKETWPHCLRVQGYFTSIFPKYEGTWLSLSQNSRIFISLSQSTRRLYVQCLILQGDLIFIGSKYKCINSHYLRVHKDFTFIVPKYKGTIFWLSRSTRGLDSHCLKIKGEWNYF